MESEDHEELHSLMGWVREKNPGQDQFIQAVEEVMTSLVPFVRTRPEYARNDLLKRLTEPDRIVIFRVTWEDDQGEIQLNRGYRVQFNGAIGPYKGGLRFHPSVSLAVFKFLGFEQTLKNSLTSLPMGGAKGGSDFNPKGKSDREVMRFCQAFMTELSRHIGAHTDVPAGDIGVGGREIGYLFGQYRRLTNRFSSVLTGKAPDWSGSLMRVEATGYGAIFFLEEMMKLSGESLPGKRCVISGAGNVATHAAEKAIEEGAIVVTLSDSKGYIHAPKGITAKELVRIKEIKSERGSLEEYAKESGTAYNAGKRPWGVTGEIAIPCATENELDEDDADELLGNGLRYVVEGANMPCTPKAVSKFQAAGTCFAPGKAANAGGVAVSGLEMAQNAQRLSWKRERVDQELRRIMGHIHDLCAHHGREGNRIHYVDGANIGGFVRVANAMQAYGIM